MVLGDSAGRAADALRLKDLNLGIRLLILAGLGSGSNLIVGAAAFCQGLELEISRVKRR